MPVISPPTRSLPEKFLSMKIAYDVKLFRPASVEVAMRLGADTEPSKWFDPKHWLLERTPDMMVAEVTWHELRHLVYLTEAHANKRKRNGIPPV